MTEPALFGDHGTRTETVEWGLRHTRDGFGPRGHIEPRTSEAHARSTVGNPYLGCGHTEVVSRTVVTYTTEWKTN